MYLGRIVCAGMTRDGKPCAAYRVSSRSFPNRSAKLITGKIAILPRAGFESDLAKNPYIAYNCIRLSGAVWACRCAMRSRPACSPWIMKKTS